MEIFRVKEPIETDELIAWSITFAVLGIIVTVINALALYTFIKNTSLRTRKHVMILNLTVADFLFGATAMSTTVFYLLKSTDIAFYVFTVSNTFPKIASLLTLGVIAVERMHAIVWPLRHQVMPNVVYKIAIVLIWVLSAAVATNASLGDKLIPTLAVVLPIVLLSAIITIVASYISIWVSIQRRNRRKLGTSTKQDKALAVTLLLVAGAFVVTWVIPMLYVSISHICKTCHQPTFSLLMWVHLVFALQSVINPVIYCFRIPGFKDRLKAKIKKIKCLKKGRRQPAIGSKTINPARNEVNDFVTAL